METPGVVVSSWQPARGNNQTMQGSNVLLKYQLRTGRKWREADVRLWIYFLFLFFTEYCFDSRSPKIPGIDNKPTVLTCQAPPYILTPAGVARRCICRRTDPVGVDRCACVCMCADASLCVHTHYGVYRLDMPCTHHPLASHSKKLGRRVNINVDWASVPT